MSIFKTFAVICTLLSLSVQGAAYAAAMPQGEMIQTMDCAEMASHDADGADSRKAQDTEKPCDNMTLGCLVAMGCIAPLSLSGISDIDLGSHGLVSVYTVALADKLDGKPTRPESPPPQMNLLA